MSSAGRRHGNRTGRMVSIYRDRPINAPARTEVFRHIVATNRAGGWRKVGRERSGAG